MIRINLLPFRAARKKENVKRQITVYVLVVFLLLSGMAYSFIQLSSELNGLKKEEKGVRAELKTYDKTIRKIKKLEKKIKEIKAKLNVIKGLEKNKTGPVHLLAEISKAVPTDKLWLTSFRESKGILNLSGTAMDNETVALFMTNLEKSSFIKTVDLKSATLQNLKKYKLKVSNFDLQCRTYAYKKKKPKKKKKKRKRR
ncbi:MAG: PilN domain-containing protein [Deltaproteobacteria bacterium]|nr:PilN domain-containing protein [Deltaproteobacteria bacterium]